MGVMQFNIPDDIAKAFEGAEVEANALVVETLRKAAEERGQVPKRPSLLDQMRQLRAASGSFTAQEIRDAREEGRP